MGNTTTTPKTSSPVTEKEPVFNVVELILPSVVYAETTSQSTKYLTEVILCFEPDSVLFGYYADILKHLLMKQYDNTDSFHPLKPIILHLGVFISTTKLKADRTLSAMCRSMLFEFIHPTSHRFIIATLPLVPMENTLVRAEYRYSDNSDDILTDYLPFQKTEAMRFYHEINERLAPVVKTATTRNTFSFTDYPFSRNTTFPRGIGTRGRWAFGPLPEHKAAHTWLVNKKKALRSSKMTITDILSLTHSLIIRKNGLVERALANTLRTRTNCPPTDKSPLVYHPSPSIHSSAPPTGLLPSPTPPSSTSTKPPTPEKEEFLLEMDDDDDTSLRHRHPLSVTAPASHSLQRSKSPDSTSSTDFLLDD